MIVTCITQIRETGWPVATPWAVACGSGRGNCSSFCQTGYSEKLRFSFYVRVRKFNRDFLCALISNMLAQPGQQLKVQRPLGRPAGTASNFGTLNSSSSSSNLFLLNTCTVVCHRLKVQREKQPRCHKCDVGLWVNRTCLMECLTMLQV